MRSERGSATLLAVIWMMMLVTIGVGAAVLVGIWSLRVRVASAADLGALAAANLVLERPDAACRQAEGVVAANRAVMINCRVDGIDVWVDAQVDWPGVSGSLLSGASGVLRARAHATITAA